MAASPAAMLIGLALNVPALRVSAPVRVRVFALSLDSAPEPEITPVKLMALLESSNKFDKLAMLPPIDTTPVPDCTFKLAPLVRFALATAWRMMTAPFTPLPTAKTLFASRE